MTAPNRAELARSVLFWTAVGEEAKAQACAAREALESDARAELAQTGAAPTWRVPGVGTIPLALTTPAVVVDDPAAYLEYVQARYPTEVETVTRVRDAFDAQLRRRLADLGGDPVCDDEGTVVAGLRFIPGGQPRGVSVRPVPGAKAQVALQARALLGLTDGVREVPGG